MLLPDTRIELANVRRVKQAVDNFFKPEFDKALYAAAVSGKGA